MIIKPTWHTRRAAAKRNLESLVSWFSVDFVPVDAEALRNELLAVLERHVPQDEPIEGE